MKKILALIILFTGLGAAAAVPTGSLLDGVKPGPDGKIDVLLIFPHEDDETIFVGGSVMAMKKDPRVKVHIMCLTLGDKSAANEILKITPETQGKIRSQELRAAAVVLGADEVIQLDYHDQGLTGANQQELIDRIAGAIAKTHAEMVITYGPDGITGHPDHKTCSRVVTDAFKTSMAQELYYVSLAPWEPAPGGKRPARATVRVDIRPYRKMKLLAIDENATQKWFAGWFQHIVMVDPMSYEYFALANDKAAP